MKREKTKQINEFVKNLELAIKQNCYDCQGGHKKLDCLIERCHLYPFRPFTEKSVWPKFR
jgi:hypothetical protein